MIPEPPPADKSWIEMTTVRDEPPCNPLLLAAVFAGVYSLLWAVEVAWCLFQ